jgi:uncharacterized protein
VTTVERFEDPRAFREAAGPFLLADEARHNLQLGICGRLQEDALAFGDEAPYLSVVHDGGEVVAVTIRTPPFQVLVSTTDLSTLGAIADDVRTRFDSIPGVLATPEEAAAFADAWTERTGQPAVRGMPQRIYQLTVPPDVPPTPGRYRAAGPPDRDLLVRWLDEFVAEALPDQPARPASEMIDERLASPTPGLFLWEDGEPVSLAGFGGETPNGIRVGPVYTPPPLRGRGYAGACVASMSADLLRGGHRFCFLFTDLRNPVSNRLYERLGYEPVCDMQEMRFEDASVG